MRAMTRAFNNDPNKKAKRLAIAMRGVSEKTKLKASWPCQKEAPGNATAIADKTMKTILMKNAKWIIKRA